MLNDYTNPFEAAVVDGEVQELDQYRRKMRGEQLGDMDGMEWMIL